MLTHLRGSLMGILSAGGLFIPVTASEALFWTQGSVVGVHTEVA